MSKYKLTLSSERGEAVISPDSGIRLLSGGLIGFGGPGFEVETTPLGMTEGAYISKRQFSPRVLSLKLEVGGEEAEQNRRRLMRLLDTKTEPTLRAEIYGIDRKIRLVPSGQVKMEESRAGCFIITLTFIAPDVYFSDCYPKRVEFYTAKPLLTFPMSFYSGAGTAAGFYVTTNEADIDNPGDAECGFVLRVRTKGGDIVNPALVMGDSFVKCSATLSDGDELVVSTVPRQKSITKNGETLTDFHRDSRFFRLPAGVSRLSLTADSGEEYFDASVEFVPLYLGV